MTRANHTELRKALMIAAARPEGFAKVEFVEHGHAVISIRSICTPHSWTKATSATSTLPIELPGTATSTRWSGAATQASRPSASAARTRPQDRL